MNVNIFGIATLSGKTQIPADHDAASVIMQLPT